ncbi:MAG: hypothetical protein WBC78_00045, partial [Candidatus Sulfotelmatobacter sp.]
LLSGGYLLLNGADTFAGGTVDGSKFLYTEGTTTVSGLTIGGTVEWENSKTVDQSGDVTLGGRIAADKAILFDTANATYDILDNSGIERGSSTATYIDNAGKFEKTGGTGTSTIAPYVINTGKIEVSAGKLDFREGIYGTGSDTISGFATLEFDAKVLAGQTVFFTGMGGEFALKEAEDFHALIRSFGAGGAHDSIDAMNFVHDATTFSFSENRAHTLATLTLKDGADVAHFDLSGDYVRSDFKVGADIAGTGTLIKFV